MNNNPTNNNNSYKGENQRIKSKGRNRNNESEERKNDKKRISQQGLTLNQVSLIGFLSFQYIKSHEYFSKFMEEIQVLEEFHRDPKSAIQFDTKTTTRESKHDAYIFRTSSNLETEEAQAISPGNKILLQHQHSLPFDG